MCFEKMECQYDEIHRFLVLNNTFPSLNCAFVSDSSSVLHSSHGCGQKEATTTRRCCYTSPCHWLDPSRSLM